MTSTTAVRPVLRPAPGTRLTRTDLWWVVVGYLLTRAAAVGAAVLAAASRDRPPGSLWTTWDGAYYLDVARDGYPTSLPVGPAGVGQSEVAFFPLLPLLAAVPVRLGAPWALTAGALNLALGGLAAVGVAALVARWAGRRTGVGVALLWCALPLSFVLSMGYAEALYCALAVGCLLLLLRRQWLGAAAVCAVAGLARPNGVLLALTVAAAVALAWRDPAERTPRAAAAMVLAPLGFLGHLAHLWWRTGRADAWTATQREGWGVYVDGGRETARRMTTYVLDPTERPAATAVAVVVLLAVVLLALAVRDGTPTPLLLFAGLTLALCLATRNNFSSIPRLLLPVAFVLLVPVVRRLEQRWPGGASGPGPAVLGALASCTALMALAGAYTMTVSEFPP